MTLTNSRSRTDTEPSHAELATTRYAGFGFMSDADRASLMALAGPFLELERGAFLTHEGDEEHGLFLLLSGWTASTVSFSDGGRAIVKVHMPGDMLGSPSMALAQSADTIVALTGCVVTRLSRKGIGDLFKTNPRLAAILFLISQEERVMLMDRVASAARGNALRHIAFLLMQLHARASRSKAVDESGFNLPLSQADFADLAGLTTTHTNRMLKQLHRDGIVTWTRGRVEIMRADELRRIADLPPRSLAREPDWLPQARA